MTIDFEKILDRIKSLKSLKTQGDVAAVLGFERTALAQRKRTGSIPYAELIDFSLKERVSIDWLLTGKSQMVMMEPSVHWGQATFEEALPEETRKYVEMAIKILGSGNEAYVGALKSNLVALHNAVAASEAYEEIKKSMEESPCGPDERRKWMAHVYYYIKKRGAKNKMEGDPAGVETNLSFEGEES